MHLRTCPLLASCMAISTARACAIWLVNGVVRAGRGITPKTRSSWHSPSRPIVVFTARKASWRNCLPEVSRSSSDRSWRKTASSGAWYVSTVPIVPRFLISPSWSVTPSVAPFSLIYLLMYALPWSTVSWSGGPTYTNVQSVCTSDQTSCALWILKKNAAQTFVAMSIMWITGFPGRNMVSTWTLWFKRMSSVPTVNLNIRGAGGWVAHGSHSAVIFCMYDLFS